MFNSRQRVYRRLHRFLFAGRTYGRRMSGIFFRSRGTYASVALWNCKTYTKTIHYNRFVTTTDENCVTTILIRTYNRCFAACRTGTLFQIMRSIWVFDGFYGRGWLPMVKCQVWFGRGGGQFALVFEPQKFFLGAEVTRDNQNRQDRNRAPTRVQERSRSIIWKKKKRDFIDQKHGAGNIK